MTHSSNRGPATGLLWAVRLLDLDKATTASRAATGVMFVAAVASCLRAPSESDLPLHTQALFVLFILFTAAVNTEAGRWVEGRLFHGDRPNKSLSVWAMCTALMVSPIWLIPVVSLTYAHTYWRGMRLPLWKWVGSASVISVAAILSGVTFHRVGDGLRLGAQVRPLAGVLTALLIFVLAEAAMLLVFACAGHDEDEQLLRARLRSSGFYATEICLLCVGALSVLLYVSAPWFLILMLPVYVISQQAAVIAPLRTEAETDDKTRLLRFESWRIRAHEQIERATEHDQPWAVLFIDIDHFKEFNDTQGHQAGDQAIRLVADCLCTITRSGDLCCRFGGEEFAVLTSAPPERALSIGEQLRGELRRRATTPMTVSVGIAAVQPADVTPISLSEAMDLADRLLYQAKQAGRDRVLIGRLPAVTPEPRRPAEPPVAARGS